MFPFLGVSSDQVVSAVQISLRKCASP